MSIDRLVFDFPMPISENEMYATVGRRRIKSAALRQYHQQCNIWVMKYQPIFKELRRIGQSKQVLRMNIDFYFLKNRIFCKDGRPKKLDASNRLKPIHDVISELMGLDDCYLWCGSFNKLVGSENFARVEILEWNAGERLVEL